MDRVRHFSIQHVRFTTRRVSSRCLAGLVVGLFLAQSAGGELKTESASVRELITQLDSGSYHARKQATQQLIARGTEAAIPLVQAVQEGSREVMMRAIHVLGQQARSDDPAIEQTARAALERTIQIGNQSAIISAQDALASVDRWRQTVALQTLRDLGAETPDAMLIDRTFFQAGHLADHELIIGDAWRGQPADLRHLRWVTDLRQLYVAGKRISDEDLKHIVQTPNLESIVLYRTSVTDKGLAHLTQMENLHSIDIQYLPLSDEGVQHLVKIPSLFQLRLKGTKVSDEGARLLATRVGENNFYFHRGALLGVEADPTILAGNGCPIRSVTRGSAAEAGGLRGGDVITAINDDQVDSFNTLRTLMAKRSAGEEITIQYRRDGEVHTAVTVLGEWKLRLDDAGPPQPIPPRPIRTPQLPPK